MSPRHFLTGSCPSQKRTLSPPTVRSPVAAPPSSGSPLLGLMTTTRASKMDSTGICRLPTSTNTRRSGARTATRAARSPVLSLLLIRSRLSHSNPSSNIQSTLSHHSTPPSLFPIPISTPPGTSSTRPPPPPSPKTPASPSYIFSITATRGTESREAYQQAYALPSSVTRSTSKLIKSISPSASNRRVMMIIRGRGRRRHLAMHI